MCIHTYQFDAALNIHCPQIVAVASISNPQTHAQIIAYNGHRASTMAVYVRFHAGLKGCVHMLPESISCHIVLSCREKSSICPAAQMAPQT